MGRIKSTVPALAFMYGEALDTVTKSGKCGKCWGTDLAFACFKSQTQVYTFPDPEGRGLYVFDVDKARSLVGNRIDGQIDAPAIRNAVGDGEPGHEHCLLRRAMGGELPPMGESVGIVCPVPNGFILIDGTHRARLCMAAGVALPIAALSVEEAAQVMLTRPPNSVADLHGLEMERMNRQFETMNADEFFTRIEAAIGKPRLIELLGDQS